MGSTVYTIIHRQPDLFGMGRNCVEMSGNLARKGAWFSVVFA
jgi:hypothetical protein